jgi:hypothetical protein
VIRFVPDSLIEVILRPVAMAAPNSGIYVEIMAPDMRFAFLICAVLLVVFSSSGRRSIKRAVIVPLTGFGIVVFIIWSMTSGNGRYFLPGLILVGPLLIGWIHKTFFSNAMKLILGGLMLAVQGWAVWQTAPWDSWSQTAWVPRTGFQITIDERARVERATYVTLTSPTYSIIAPKFNQEARWINLDALQGRRQPVDEKKIHDLFSSSQLIRLIIPAESPRAQVVSNAELISAFNRRLEPEGLKIATVSDCRIVLSTSMRPRVPTRLIREHDVVELGSVGFWICDLSYDISTARPLPKMPEAIASLIGKIEQACPRFFPPSRGQTTVLRDMTIVNYPSSDMKIYANNSGEISYLYYRALNPVQIAWSGVLRSDTKNWCENIQGRSGVLWNRGL